MLELILFFIAFMKFEYFSRALAVIGIASINKFKVQSFSIDLESRVNQAYYLISVEYWF